MTRLQRWLRDTSVPVEFMVLVFAMFVLAFSVLDRTSTVEAQPTGAATYPVYGFSHIAANATTQVLTGAGVLHTICINDAGASANIASVYDDDDGTSDVIAIIDTVTTAGVCLRFDVAVSTGVRVITATGTAADLTVTYRALR